MTDQNIVYTIAALSLGMAIFGKAWKRTGTIQEWISDSYGYVIASITFGAIAILIGPGDGADLGSYVVRTWAAGIPVLINEAASAFIRGPQATKLRKADALKA